MSVTFLPVNSSLIQAYTNQNDQNGFQQIQSAFQQLGQDLQAGNLTQAQEDFATLSQDLPGLQQSENAGAISSGAGNSSGNPIEQAFAALGQALQQGNLSAAQQDFATIQQDSQQAQGSGQPHHHHHHHFQGANQAHSSGDQQDSIFQAFNSLGQALQSGNLSAAQQAYTAIQQDFAQFDPFASTSSSSTSATQSSTSNSNSQNNVSITV
jgi:outer membrane protein assembly factor BamD (BamD/ComL family)